VTVPAALVMLVLAGAALLLAGTGLLVSADQRRRSAEVARLRALGLTRRSARRLLFVEHVAFLIPLVLVGTLVGAVAAVVLGPSLIRSDIAAAPVPSALVEWPWSTEAGLLGGLLLGCVVIAAVVAALHVRRAETAQLRAGDS
jgi:ABC-type antimicrobial peptide transport system permease subunit